MSRLSSLCLAATVVVICSAGLPFSAPAQDSSPVTCTLSASRGQVVFGDSLTIGCTVIIPPGATIVDPALDGTEAPDADAPVWKRTAQSANGSTRIDYGFLIHAFAPDTLRVGPARGEAIGPDGTSYPYQSDTVLLTVGTVLAAADTIPYPLRAPVTIVAQGFPGWIVILAICIFLLLVAVLAYRAVKRRTQAQTPPAALPVDEIEVFRKIAALALHEKGRHKDLYALVSEAMRSFLHRNMPFDARHETTTEIIRELGVSGYHHTMTDAIRDILLESDQVMFARYVPSWEQSASIVDRAIAPVGTILEENRRRMEAALAEAAETADESADSTDNTTTAPEPVEPGGAA